MFLTTYIGQGYVPHTHKKYIPLQINTHYKFVVELHLKHYEYMQLYFLEILVFCVLLCFLEKL